jgi:UDP-N-acetylmuramate dehydrogenase
MFIKYTTSSKLKAQMSKLKVKTQNYSEIIKRLGKGRVVKNQPLAPYTSIKIGGPADLFFEAETNEDLIKAVQLAKKYQVSYFILGGGTNLLVSDKGFRGLVIRNRTSSIKLIKVKGVHKVNTVYIKVDAGVQVNRLVRFALDEGLAGLEHFLGQPGTIGGAVWINAHNIKAGNKFFADNIVETELLDKGGNKRAVQASYFEFGYDKSKIQETGELVLSVTLKLKKGEKSKLWDFAQKTIQHRRNTQPFDFPSSGCIFRNPNNTTSTGYLLESIGLKGKQIGGAKFSEKHAAFIVNVKNAKAADVVDLIDLAKEKIKMKYNIDLKEEIVLVGKF